jgi:hypothetical protein
MLMSHAGLGTKNGLAGEAGTNSPDRTEEKHFLSLSGTHLGPATNFFHFSLIIF